MSKSPTNYSELKDCIEERLGEDYDYSGEYVRRKHKLKELTLEALMELMLERAWGMTGGAQAVSEDYLEILSEIIDGDGWDRLMRREREQYGINREDLEIA